METRKQTYTIYGVCVEKMCVRVCVCVCVCVCRRCINVAVLRVSECVLLAEQQ